MPLSVNTDITIIGGGPGGYVAAIRAAQLGANVIVIERDILGGTCLNRGCIPAKAFVESSIRYKSIKEASKFGLGVSDITFDFTKIYKRKNQVVKRIVKGVEALLAARNIQVLNGTGSFVDSNTIMVRGGEEEYLVKTGKTIIATGSKCLIPSLIPGSTGQKVIGSNEVLNFDFVPKSMIIIGGGVIGCEFANIFNTFGCKVTIVEMLKTVIPMEDEDIGKELETALTRQRIVVNTGCKVTNISNSQEGEKAVTYIDPDGNEQIIKAEYVIMSIGRIPELDGLDIEKAGIKKGRRGIPVDRRMETNIKGIYAIGDVVEVLESPMLAYIASEEGEIAVENAIQGKNKEMSYEAIPSCIFTSPEVGSVGMTEKEAKERHNELLVGNFPFKGIGKAVIHNETKGFVKVIFEAESQTLVGAHIIGPHATELIAELTLAVKNKLTVHQIIETLHCHPVLYEAIREAALDALGRAIHK